MKKSLVGLVGLFITMISLSSCNNDHIKEGCNVLVKHEYRDNGDNFKVVIEDINTPISFKKKYDTLTPLLESTIKIDLDNKIPPYSLDKDEALTLIGFKNTDTSLIYNGVEYVYGDNQLFLEYKPFPSINSFFLNGEAGNGDITGESDFFMYNMYKDKELEIKMYYQEYTHDKYLTIGEGQILSYKLLKSREELFESNSLLGGTQAELDSLKSDSKIINLSEYKNKEVKVKLYSKVFGANGEKLLKEEVIALKENTFIKAIYKEGIGSIEVFNY